MLRFKLLSHIGGLLSVGVALAGCNSMIPDTGSTDTVRFVQEIMPVQPHPRMMADLGPDDRQPNVPCLNRISRYEGACDPILTGSLPSRAAAYGYSLRSGYGGGQVRPSGSGSDDDGYSFSSRDSDKGGSDSNGKGSNNGKNGNNHDGGGNGTDGNKGADGNKGNNGNDGNYDETRPQSGYSVMP